MYSRNSHARILLVYSLHEPKIKVQVIGAIIWLLSRPTQEGWLIGKCGGLECKT
jgi:hypothetical protein